MLMMVGLAYGGTYLEYISDIDFAKHLEFNKTLMGKSNHDLGTFIND